MKQRYIETFLSIIRTKNLSLAARELNVSQTTVSQRLKVLERDIGITLIERGKGIQEITLTNDGEDFLKLAIQLENVWAEIDTLSLKEPELSLTVGSIDTFNNFVLMDVYQALYKYTPMSLKSITSNSVNLYSQIEKKQVDVAFVLVKRNYPSVEVTKWQTSPMVVLQLTPDPVQKRTYIHPNDLDGTYEIYIPWSQIGYDRWHKKWWGENIESRIKLNNINLLLSLLQDYRQWVIVPEYIAESITKNNLDYDYFYLSDSAPEYTCYKLTHTNTASTTVKALEVFYKYYQLYS